MSSEPPQEQSISRNGPPTIPSLSATSTGVVAADRTAAIFRNVYNSLMSFEDEINECHNELRRLHVSSQLPETSTPSATTRDYEALLQQRLQFAKRMRDTQHQHLTTLTNAMYLEQEEGSAAATAAASPIAALRGGPNVGEHGGGGGGATPPRNFFERVFGFQEMAYETTRSCFLSAATFPLNATAATSSSSFLPPLPSSIFEGAVGSNSTIVAERCMIDLPRLRSSAAACGATLTTAAASATPLDCGYFADASVQDLRDHVTALIQANVAAIGYYWRPSTTTTTTRTDSNGGGGLRPSKNIVADVAQLHADIASLQQHQQHFGVTFQVASQMNFLEFASPHHLPEHGIAIYEDDRTQGPACAVSCAGGTAYRNFLVPLTRTGNGTTTNEECRGQTTEHQLNALRGVQAVLQRHRHYVEQQQQSQQQQVLVSDGAAPPTTTSANPTLLAVHNGYTNATAEALHVIRQLLLVPNVLEEVIAQVRVGVQEKSAVTPARTPSPGVTAGPPRCATQVYCSALSIAYSSVQDPDAWEPIAQAVLVGVYEATLLVGVLDAIRRVIAQSCRRGNINNNNASSSTVSSYLPPRLDARVYLTKVGGGVFGNRAEWIGEAIRAASARVTSCVRAALKSCDVDDVSIASIMIPLHVFVVHHGGVEAGY